MPEDFDPNLIRRKLKYWIEPTGHKSTWTLWDVIMKDLRDPLPNCLCGAKLLRTDKFCEECGVDNWGFDEELYWIANKDQTEDPCEGDHKLLVMEMFSEGIPIKKFCSHCGARLPEPPPFP